MSLLLSDVINQDQESKNVRSQMSKNQGNGVPSVGVLMKGAGT